MKAVYIEAHGGPEVLTYGEQPEPSPGPGQIKIRVRATALNRLDTYVRAGQRGLRKTFPPAHIPGGDSAGEVAEVGSQVTDLKAGDRVVVNPRYGCGQCPACLSGSDDLCLHSQFLGSTGNGSYAEYVVAPAANVHGISDTVTYEQAAAVPTTFLPVWNMLVRKAQLRPWETVLVLSASAGVGSAALQVAKRVIGARVIATTSTPEKAARARELGADEVINYSVEDMVERARELTGGQGVDVVLDHVGAEFFEKAIASLRRGGRFATCGVTAGYRVELHLGMLFTQQLQLYGAYMGTREDMQQIVKMLNRGVIQPVIHQVFPLSQAADAHRTMEERSFFGKMVLVP